MHCEIHLSVYRLVLLNSIYAYCTICIIFLSSKWTSSFHKILVSLYPQHKTNIILPRWLNVSCILRFLNFNFAKRVEVPYRSNYRNHLWADNTHLRINIVTRNFLHARLVSKFLSLSRVFYNNVRKRSSFVQEFHLELEPLKSTLASRETRLIRAKLAGASFTSKFLHFLPEWKGQRKKERKKEMTDSSEKKFRLVQRYPAYLIGATSEPRLKNMFSSIFSADEIPFRQRGAR